MVILLNPHDLQKKKNRLWQLLIALFSNVYDKSSVLTIDYIIALR